MLSSVSYVCLDMCGGLWVISRGINLGLLVLSFISVLLFQRSGHFCLFLTFYYRCVCVCFLLLFCRCFQLYFVVGSSGCGSPGIWEIPCKFSSGCCVG